MTTAFNNIPQSLKTHPNWVCWKFMPNSSDPQKPKKVPMNPKTGKCASASNPATWGTYEQAINRLNQGGFDGIGFVFSKNDNFVGIDLDNCRNKETGVIQSWAQGIISRFASYTELSPSGTGVHIIVKGQLPGKGKKVGDTEIYDQGRYFTFTGNHLDGTPVTIETRPAEIDILYASLSEQKKDKPKQNEPTQTANLTDEEILINVSFAAGTCNFEALMAGDFSAYPSQSEADLALCSLLTKFTVSAEAIDRIFRKSKLMRDKWDEYRGEHTYGQMTIAKAFEGDNKGTSEANTPGTSQYAIALAVIRRVGQQNILFTHQFWRWDEQRGVWRQVDDREFKQIIHKIADQGKLSRSHVDSVLDLIKTEAHASDHLFDINKKAINCMNGEIHYMGSVWILKQHDRNSYFTQQIPVVYDKSAKPARFLKFLKEIFARDADWLQKIQIVQEFMGYALSTTCEYERFLLLIGQGANGKSVLLKTIEALIGLLNVAGVQPSQFENRFQLAHLQGKLANIITEIPQGAVIPDAKLKAIVSGELMTAEQKHRPPFDFRPFCTMFFATNHMPHTQDFSSAFFRRAEVITFNRKFDGAERDVHLKDDLLKELPGILNFALAGLKRLYDTGDFTKLPSSEDAKQEWEREVDQVASFVDDECESSPDAESTVSELYIKYQCWTSMCGINRKVNVQNFTTRLVRLGFERKKGSKGIRMIIGIRHRVK